MADKDIRVGFTEDGEIYMEIEDPDNLLELYFSIEDARTLLDSLRDSIELAEIHKGLAKDIKTLS